MGGNRDLAALPKAHLHIHLFGSVRRTTVADLAQRAGMDAAQIEALLRQIASVDDIESFLIASHRVQDLVAAPEDVDRICREFVEDEAAAGVVHTQPSFVPHDFAHRFGMTPEALFRRMDRVFVAEGHRRGVAITYEIAPNRGRDTDYLREVAEFAVAMKHRGVVAFGYGGNEMWGHQRMREAVDIARVGGLRIDPHAGETVGAESVSEALDEFHPESFAHAVGAAASPPVLARLVRLQIPCHVSINSNVTLGVADMASHPLPVMLEAGVAVTLNADDTTFFAPSVLAEFETARSALALSDAQLATLARNSLLAAPMHDLARRRALARVDRWLQAPQQELS